MSNNNEYFRQIVLAATKTQKSPNSAPVIQSNPIPAVGSSHNSKSSLGGKNPGRGPTFKPPSRTCLKSSPLSRSQPFQPPKIARPNQKSTTNSLRKKYSSDPTPKKDNLHKAHENLADYEDFDSHNLHSVESISEVSPKAVSSTSNSSISSSIVKLTHFRDQIQHPYQQPIEGDISTTHLVKGLDRTLLARARAGENVLTPLYSTYQSLPTTTDPHSDSNIDNEFDEIERKLVVPSTETSTGSTNANDKNLSSASSFPDHALLRNKPVKKKQGTLALAGNKRRRDDIIAELKASRKLAAAGNISSSESSTVSQTSSLGPKFKKIQFS